MSDEEAPDVLELDPGSGSPVTATEDRVLDMPWRILQGSRGWKTNHRIRGRLLRLTDYGTHHRGIDAQKKTMDPEVPQMKIEDQEVSKFDFHVIPNKCF